jgi:hypothetical protein
MDRNIEDLELRGSSIPIRRAVGVHLRALPEAGAQGGPMKHLIAFSLGVALLTFAAACAVSPAQEPAVGLAQEWVSVAKADAHEAFVDPASVTVSGTMVELRAKENFASPQPAAKKNETYLSSQSTYRVDCPGRKVAYKEIQTFPAADLQGKVVQKAKFYEKNLQWMDAPADTVFGELLDYACEHAPASLPAEPPG